MQFHAQVNDEWQSLPYEIASSYVRTLMVHCHELFEAKKKAEALLGEDPEEKKKKTRDAKELHESLKKSQRWIVFNPKTGQLATQHWLQKHIKADAAGKPVVKNSKSRVKPWVMVFHFESQDGETVLSLQRDPDKPQQKIRCVDIRNGQSHAALSFFMQGYQHFLDEEDEQDDGEESEDTMVGEDEGLEGLPCPR